jgi:hypothetical protein
MPAQTFQENHIFDLRKQPDGSWIIVAHARG